VAAKSERGSLKDPFTTEGKPYFFDQGMMDQMGVCYSCHPGGGPAEGIVQSDGTVTPFDDPSLSPVHSYDRDFYSYSPNTITQALLSQGSISQTMSALGDPKRVDWNKTGVMEADCLLCHIDPESPYALHAADGLKAQAFRPRYMIFAERQNGSVTKISLGMPLTNGLANESVLNYTDPAQRMGRPTAMMVLAKLPAKNVGEMMKMWTDGLKAMEAQGVNLPYALYGENVQKIWGPQGIKAEYCANPNGPADEMQRLMGARNALGQMFQGFLTYLKNNGLVPPDTTMEQMMGMFFNDFIYAYQIKDQMGNLLPIPVALRAYEKGKFYTNWDSPDASVRDYVRAPLIEGDKDGIPYSGMVGIGWGATMFAIQKYMQGDPTYMKPNGQPDVAKVMTDLQKGVIPPNAVVPTLHNYLHNFFYLMPSAQLMGLDFNQDGAPITYIQLVKTGNDWQGKVYWNVADLGDGSIHMEMFGGQEDINSYKWVKICGQCHVMTQDHGNSEWTRARLYNLGMPADWVKNGHFVNWTDNEEAPGFDVHMSRKKMGCGSCHLREVGNLEDKHNFRKGTDTAHMVRNDLDNNPKPRTCESCHLGGEDPEAPNPTSAHEEKFGENTGRHMAEIACQTCHVPYRKTWRFRMFDDTLGYYGNFDNRFGYNILPGGDGSMMAFPGPYALSPVYGTSPGYGIPHFHMVSHHINADGNGILPMDFVSQMVDYFNLNGSADPGQLVNGMPTNFAFDFWKYFYQVSLMQYQQMGVPITFDKNYDHEVYPPLYWANGANGYPQIVIGNPITIMTWVDVNPQPDHDMSDIAYGGAKVLYLKEINAAIRSFFPPVQLGKIDPMTMAMIPPNDPSFAQNPYVGKIVLKDSGYVIFDHTGDMYPDLWWPEDVKAMQEALTKVLKAEGETNPMPVIFMAAHYFSDSHGVQPAEKALGAKSCYDCHGDYKKDPGAHRITDRVVVYGPWAPPFFTEENRLLRYAPDEVPADAPIWMKRAGMVLNNPNGLFVVDGEVAYIQPIQADGLSVLGAKEEDILKLSKHHAEELFYMVAEGTVKGDEIEDIDAAVLTPEEREMEYVRQVVNSPWNQKLYFYIPKELKPEIAECGFQPSAEPLYLEGEGMAEGYVLKLGFNEDVSESMIIRLPYNGPNPVIVTKTAGKTSFERDKSAQILDQTGGYVTVKVNHAGEFAAVNTQFLLGPNGEQWQPFLKD